MTGLGAGRLGAGLRLAASLPSADIILNCSLWTFVADGEVRTGGPGKENLPLEKMLARCGGGSAGIFA